MLMRKNVNNLSAEFACTCGRAKTLRVEAFFFEKGEKKLVFQTNTYGYVWTGPKSSWPVKLKNAFIIPYCNAMVTNQKTN